LCGWLRPFGPSEGNHRQGGWPLIFGDKPDLRSACPAGHLQRVLGASGSQRSAYACGNATSRTNFPQGTLRSEFPVRLAVNSRPEQKNRREFPAGPFPQEGVPAADLRLKGHNLQGPWCRWPRPFRTNERDFKVEFPAWHPQECVPSAADW